MFDALRRVTTTVVTVLQSRTELAGLELAQAQGRLLRWITGALIAAAFLLAALLVATFVFVAALWADYGWRAALWPLGLFVVIGVAVAWRIRTEISNAPSPLARTSAELARDRDVILAGFSKAQGAPEEREDAQR